MSLTLALVLGAVVPTQADLLPNLDFRTGQLTHWQGQGFLIESVKDSDGSRRTGQGGPREYAVSSRDDGREGRTALLYRTFTVPRGVGAICCTAQAVRPDGPAPGTVLDLYIEAGGGKRLTRQVRTTRGLEPAPRLLEGNPREYIWDVSAYTGQTVRIVVLDADDRPGCSLRCGGFRLISTDEFQVREFTAHMGRLERAYELPALARFDSRHFLAISNAADSYTRERLADCETLYAVFFDHFRRKGFSVRPPDGKLMVAVFDSQVGFEAYLGRRMSPSITGLYHTPSNRLVVYDYAGNRAFLAARARGRALAQQAPSLVQSQQFLGALSRQAGERRADANMATMMHETAHQLSFNTGLLNREGDVPAWLAEGLACYCEAVDNGAWQGIGEPNPQRAARLAGPAHGQGAFLPLHTLLADDRWVIQPRRVDDVLLGYAQSWALFRLLMEERPHALRTYLALIYARPTEDRRLADFTRAFGSDLARFERRYQAYMREIVRQEVRPGR